MIKVLFMMICIAFGAKSSAAEYVTFSQCCCATPCGLGVQMKNGDMEPCCMGGEINASNICLGTGCFTGISTVASCICLPVVSWVVTPITCCGAVVCCGIGAALHQD